MDTVLTTCPFCPSGCGLYLCSSDGKPTGVMPSEHHPVSRGRLCARGWGSHEAVAWGERLTEPLLRHDGRLRPVSWEVAMAAAADTLVAIWRAGRDVGVLGSPRATNEENYLAARLARGALRTPHLDSAFAASYRPLLDGVAAVTGAHEGRGTIADLEGCDTILLVEGDVAATHPQVAGAIVRALAAGARLITVGALPTEMTMAATLPITVPPDRIRVATFGMVAAVVAAGRIDTTVAVTAGVGLEDLRRSVAGAAPAEPVVQAAHWLAAARRAAIVVAPQLGGAETLRALGTDLATLAAVTGQLGREGSALLVLPSRGNLRGACEAGVTPDLLPGFAPLDDDGAAQRLRVAWGGELARERGFSAAEMVAKSHAVVVLADDPAAAMADGDAARDELRAKECVVLLDSFATSALEVATVVLPIAAFAENDGTVTALDGRVQRVRPVVPPPGESRPGWAVLADLLRRLGAGVAYRSAADVHAELAAVVPALGGARQRDLDEGWGYVASSPRGAAAARLTPLSEPVSTSESGTVVVWDGVVDWGADPLVRFSPTLSRDSVAQRKLYPNGVVEMAAADLERLGVRPGWSVRLRSGSGDAVAPVVPRAGLAPGVVVVPYPIRGAFTRVMGGRSVATVSVERA